MSEASERLERVRMLRQQAKEAAHKSDLEGAARYYGEAVALLRTLGEPQRLASAARHWGGLLHELGKSAAAEELCREALAICRADLDVDPLELANSLRMVAVVVGENAQRGVSTDHRAIVEARTLWEEARGLYASVGVHAGVQECGERVAGLAKH